MTEPTPDLHKPVSTAEAAWIDALMKRMTSLDSSLASLNLLLYGDSGVGKTVESVHIAQAITATEKAILYIDSGEGWVSLQNHYKLLNRVHRMTLTRSSQLEEIGKAIQQKIGFFGTVGCVIVDEHSSIADYDLLAVTKARAGKDDKGDKDPDQPLQPDMGVTTNRIHKFTAPLITLPDVHIILVAHQRQDKDNLGHVRTSPSYMPALNKYMRGLVHVVGYLAADEVSVADSVVPQYNRTIQVMPTRRIVAKTRIGGFASTQVTPNEFITAAKEWLKGERPTQEKDTIQRDNETVEVNVELIADEVTETVEEETLEAQLVKD